MSVKPLDLQVNINTIHVTSQREGARVAEHVFSQRQMDEKVIDEAKRNLHRIVKTEESAESQILNDRNEDDKKKADNSEIEKHDKKVSRQGQQKRHSGNSFEQDEDAQWTDGKAKADEKRATKKSLHHIDTLA